MNTENLFWDCACFLIDKHGLIEAANQAAELSRQAFENNDQDKHLFWKFVFDQIDGPYGINAIFQNDDLEKLEDFTSLEDWAA